MQNEINRQLRVLYVDSNRFRSLLIIRAFTHLKDSVVISHFESPLKAIEELQKNHYQIALIPNNIKTSDGKFLVEVIRSNWNDLFIISVGTQKSGKKDEQTNLYIQPEEISPESLHRAIEQYKESSNIDYNVISSGNSNSYSQKSSTERQLAEIH